MPSPDELTRLERILNATEEECEAELAEQTWAMSEAEIDADLHEVGIDPELLVKEVRHRLGLETERALTTQQHDMDVRTALFPSEMCVAETVYKLRQSATDASLQEVEGLGQRALRLTRQKDIEQPGRAELRLLVGDKPVIVPLHQFEDVRKPRARIVKEVPSGIRAAAKETADGIDQARNFLLYRCFASGLALEFLGDRDGRLFLRLMEQR